MKRLLFIPFVLFASIVYAQGTATPTSRLAWDEVGQALNTAQSGTYNIYVDNSTTPIVATTVTCALVAATTTCDSAFPALTPGQHTITLTQVITGAESAKSSPLSFTFVVVVTPTNVRVK